MTNAVAITSLSHGLNDLKDFLRSGEELIKTREERKHLEDERKHQEVEDERKRQEIERLEQQQHLMMLAIDHMQEVDSDLSPEDQAFLVQLFQEQNNAKAYVALKSKPVREAWIKLKRAA